jgi:polysaccharide pyruvyl transferase CsaB
VGNAVSNTEMLQPAIAHDCRYRRGGTGRYAHHRKLSSAEQARLLRMRVGVSAWVGSTNLGDELVFASLHAKVAERGAKAVAFSVAPDATLRDHRVPAVRRPRGLLELVKGMDALILGGGGLLQDETSALNLPYHLSPLVVARARRLPVAGIGLGAGPLRRASSRRMVAAALRSMDITVRDVPSAELLATLDLQSTVGADLAFGLAAPPVPVGDSVALCLRGWAGGGGAVPVGWRRPASPGWFVAGAAELVDQLVDETGLEVRLIAFDPHRDASLLREVAERSQRGAEVVLPTLETVLAEVASARVVVAMRYHAAVAAALAGRPAVLIGYSPKVSALAACLGRGAALVPWSETGLASVPANVSDVLDHGDAVREAADRLRVAEQVNDHALDRLLERARTRARRRSPTQG